MADACDDFALQFETTTKTLEELGFNNKYLKVLNKCDLVEDTSSLPSDCILISAKDGTGITALKEQIKKSFEERFKRLNLVVPFEKFSEYEKLRQYATELSRKYTDDGFTAEIKVEISYADKFARFCAEVL